MKRTDLTEKLLDIKRERAAGRAEAGEEREDRTETHEGSRRGAMITAFHHAPPGMARRQAPFFPGAGG